MSDDRDTNRWDRLRQQWREQWREQSERDPLEVIGITLHNMSERLDVLEHKIDLLIEIVRTK